MAKVFSRTLVAMLVLASANVLAAPPASVVITAKLKREKGNETSPTGENTAAVKTALVSYDLTLKNSTPHDLPELTLSTFPAKTPEVVVQYIFFIERQALGGKKTNSPDVQRVNGIAVLPTLKPQASTTVTTKTIELNTSNLVGNYHYENGGRIRAVDSLVGFWVRAMENGEILGEYAMPSSVMQRGWDKE